jgi:hypothetical protein
VGPLMQSLVPHVEAEINAKVLSSSPEAQRVQEPQHVRYKAPFGNLGAALAGPILGTIEAMIVSRLQGEVIPPLHAALAEIKTKHPGLDTGAVEDALQKIFSMFGAATPIQ